MALKLLEHYPSLATALDMRGESPVLALACMSFAYPSGKSAHILETMDLPP